MDQRSDHIRQDIESTRAALDEKLDTLETKTREIFDLKHHVEERPWTMIGLAAAAGYLLGSMGEDDRPAYDSTSYSVSSTNYTPKYTSEGTTSYVPSYASGRTTAPPKPSTNTTYEQRPSASDSFFAQFDDEIAMLKQAAISTLRDFLRDSIREYVPALSKQVDKLQNGHIPPYTTSSSRQVSETSTTPANSDYVKTYHPPTETERERSFGTNSQPY